MRLLSLLLVLQACDSSNGKANDLAMTDLAANDDLAVVRDLGALVDGAMPDEAMPDSRPPAYTVTVSLHGVYGASGTVGADHAGWNCNGATCSGSYAAGTNVVLTATPTGSALFQSWSGCGDPFAASCPTGALTGDVILSATFRPPVNYMFVTSTPITANQIHNDLSGADLHCDALAKAAGLWNSSGTTPTRFKAWLAKSTASATSRLAGARGWIRVDGRELADDLVSQPQQVFYPPIVDENGVTQIDRDYALTGAAPDGQAWYSSPTANGTCNDWVVASPTPSPSPSIAALGNPSAGNQDWSSTQLNAAGCSLPWNLYCFETAFTTPVSPAPVVSPSPTPSPFPRFAFLTNFTPGGGRSAADAQCEADKGALPGSYLALIATSSESAASRFTDGAPWVRPDGVYVAPTATALLAGNWSAPIIVHSDGSFEQTIFVAWTGSDGIGAVATDAQEACGDWGSSAGSGNYGSPDGIQFFWWANTTSDCVTPGAIYCLQQ